MSLKNLVNPSMLGLLLGGAFGVLQLPLPTFLLNGLSSASACMSPLAMIIAGFVIGNYSFKSLLGRPKIYVATLIRLVVLPLIFVLSLKTLHTDQLVVRATLCATALPFGLNTIVFPEAYGGDATAGAAMATVSHFLSVFSLPLVFALLL